MKTLEIVAQIIVRKSVILPLLVMLIAVQSAQGITCPSGSVIPNLQTSYKHSYDTLSSCKTFNVFLGPVSGATYFVDICDPSSTVVLRKMNADGSFAWAVSHGSPELVTRSAAITPDESFIFINMGSTTQVEIYKFSTATGQMDTKYTR